MHPNSQTPVTVRRPSTAGFAAAVALVLLTALALVGLSGSAAAQEAGPEPAPDGSATALPEHVSAHIESDTIQLRITSEDPLWEHDTTRLAFDDGRTMSGEADLATAEVVIDHFTQTITLGANDGSRYLYYAFGPYLNTEGIELWNDEREPIATRLVVEAPDQPSAVLNISYKLVRPAASVDVAYVAECDVTERGDAVVWPVASPRTVLELWYDGQPFATDLAPPNGQFDFTHLHKAKYGANLELSLVTVVPTDSGVRRVGVTCGRNWARWGGLHRSSCQVNFETGWLLARTSSTEDIELFPSRIATEPIATLGARSAAPSNVDRTDTAEFGSVYRLRIDDEFLDQSPTLVVRNGEQLGIRPDGEYVGCAVTLGTAADSALGATKRAMNSKLPLRKARQTLEDPAEATHLLQFIRREAGRNVLRASPGVNYVRSSGNLGIQAGVQPVLDLVERDGRWYITTESLCGRVAALLDANQFQPSMPCGPSGDDPDPGLCLAYRLASGMCSKQIAKNLRPIAQAVTELLGNDAPQLRGDMSEVSNRLWAIPDSLEIRVQSITRHDHNNATVVFFGLGEDTFELEAVRNRWGRWKFTVQSVCISRFLFATRPGQLPMRPIIGGGGD